MTEDAYQELLAKKIAEGILALRPSEEEQEPE